MQKIEISINYNIRFYTSHCLKLPDDIVHNALTSDEVVTGTYESLRRHY